MARCVETVTWNEKDRSRLPEVVVPGVLLLRRLQERGQLEELSDRARIRRQGGFAGVDIVVFLLLYFASGSGWSLGKFWQRMEPFRHRVAALAGRSTIPSRSAVSRALSRAETSLVREQSRWLLHELPGIDAVLQSPHVLTYDARGVGHHVFDYDPTSTVLRRADLPSGPDLPEPRLRSEHTARPGYPGRKRGEVQFRCGALHHAGSGLWLSAELRQGSEDIGGELLSALATLRAFAVRFGIAMERLVLRSDGAYGHVPAYTACREHQIRFVTRFTRPNFWEDAEVRRRLATAEWMFVPSNRSGPARSAMELGMIVVPPGHDVVRPDGTPYAPVRLRIVISRYARAGEAEHGCVIDGWQYEAFAVDLDEEAWPAPEAVALFFGRGGQENRFAQDDREFCTDRILSYHLPGQELALAVAHAVWNLQTVIGFELNPLPRESPRPMPRRTEVDGRPVPPGMLTDLPRLAPPEAAAAPSPRTWDEPPDPACAPSPRIRVVDRPEDPWNQSKLKESVVALLPTLDWDRLLADRPGWRWDPESRTLACPEHQPLRFSTVNGREDGHVRLHFRGPASTCDACPSVGRCFTQRAPHAPKIINFTLQSEEIFESDPLEPVPPSHAPTVQRGRRARPSNDGLHVLPRDSIPAAGPHAVHTPLFRASVARQSFRALCHGVHLHVTVRLPEPPSPRPLLLARDPADRQHRRQTWRQRTERNALPEGTELSITFAGPPSAATIAGFQPGARGRAA